MRKIIYAILLVLFVLVYSCDSLETDFNEALPDRYTLTTNVVPEEGGALLPSDGEYLAGERRQIIAQPAEGYVFGHWSGDLSGESNPNSIQFNSNRSVTAHFSLRDYSLNLEINGNGAVNETIVERTSTVTVRLEAEAEDEWYFDRWEGDLTGSGNPETITIDWDEEKSIKAIFLEIPPEEYTVTLSTQGNGSVDRDPNKDIYIDGDVVILTAKASLGWKFLEWRGDLSGSSNPKSVVVDADKQITAVFERKTVVEHSVIISIEGSGSVEKDPDRQTYLAGEEVALLANAASGWKFSKWQGDQSGSQNPVTLVVDTDKQIKAVFEPETDYSVTVDMVKFYIREMKLDGARTTRDFNTRDFILNVPLDGTPFEITHVTIPQGFYDELELDIKKPGNRVDVDDSDFRDRTGSYSVVVKGIYDGADFTYRSTEDFNIDVDISPHLEISGGQRSLIALTIDFNRWFIDKDGRFLNPNDSRNRKEIDKNIEDSFSDFEDDF